MTHAILIAGARTRLLRAGQATMLPFDLQHPGLPRAYAAPIIYRCFAPSPCGVATSLMSDNPISTVRIMTQVVMGFLLNCIMLTTVSPKKTRICRGSHPDTALVRDIAPGVSPLPPVLAPRPTLAAPTCVSFVTAPVTHTRRRGAGL